MKVTRKEFRFVFLLIVLLGSYVWTKKTLDQHLDQRHRSDIRYLPSPQMAKYLALGFNEALADLYWIEGINYFGEQLPRKDRDYKYLKGYFNLIEALDPLFLAFYDWGATAFIYNALPIVRDSVVESTRVANRGILNLAKVHRFDGQTILKAAFNYAIETNQRDLSIPYFLLAARTFPNMREILLVASTYAGTVGNEELATQLKMEFFGLLAFEASTKDELIKALQVLSTSKLNLQAVEFLSLLRIKMEKDDELKKLVENRVKLQSTNIQTEESNAIPASPKIGSLFEIDFTRNWIPPEMHVLLSL